MVILETIKVHHDFVVARKLTMECLLGMDFLYRHGAIIDFSKCKLTLAVHDKGKVRHEGREGGAELVVNLAQTTKIPARSQLLVRGKMESLGDTKDTKHRTHQCFLYEGTRVATFTVGSTVMALDGNNIVEPQNNEQ